MCSNIDKFTRSFIWCGSHNHRGLHLASWRVLTTPKKVWRSCFAGVAVGQFFFIRKASLANFDESRETVDQDYASEILPE